MFNKNNDIVLKIVNAVLIIIVTLSLGFGIASGIYSENPPKYSCGDYLVHDDGNYARGVTADEHYVDANNNEVSSCKYYSKIDKLDNYRDICIWWSLFGSALIILLLINQKKNNINTKKW